LKTNVWIKNLDILFTQYYQTKRIHAVMQSMSRLWNLSLFFLLVLLPPVPLVTSKYPND